MYERFYGLRERPFALSPDPDYLYPSRVHREALDYLRYGLETHAGFVVITGEIGSGKTTLLQTLLRGLDAETTVGRIVNTLLDPRELIETIMIDFGLDPAGRSKPLLLRDLAQFLVDQRMAGRLVLLVIDEAQNLSLAALEELRMLSNLETEKSKLLQIVMVGQPNLREKLNAPELEQLRQRITVSYHLQPIDADETENYINHRLRRASVGVPLEFPREVTDVIHARSRGVPRIINVICDATLVFGYAEERRQIDISLMDDVLAELETTGVLPGTGATDAVRGRESVEHSDESGRRAQLAAAKQAELEDLRRRAASDTPGTLTVPAHASAVQAPRSGASPEPAPAAAAAVAAVAPGFHVPERVTHAAPVAASAAIDDQSRRVAAIEQREELLRQRERELAQQRRVLAEEYRLLRTQRSVGESNVSPSGRTAGARFDASPRGLEGFWGWLKRVMTGTTQPTVERH